MPRLASAVRSSALGLGAAFLFVAASEASASPPSGVSLVRVLGRHAEETLAPSSRRIGALVTLPPGTRARDVGLDPVGPRGGNAGVGRFRGDAASLLRFSLAHPGLHVEVAPPLHTLLDQAGQFVRAGQARELKGVDGTGVLVGVADTGLDVSHADLRDDKGKTRVLWMLDLSLSPLGIHKDLEERFGIKDGDGNVVSGAVLSSAEIDQLLTRGRVAPNDEVGHGTHVTSIAAGNGGVNKQFIGAAPNAGIVFARVTRGSSESIENDDLLRGTEFMFERADALGKPLVVNLSVGTDFGPHDGTMEWEKQLATFVGPDKPGRALVVAAGNSGSVADTPVHQNVYVTRGTRTRVGIVTGGAQRRGSVQVWISPRGNADLRIGLDSPNGEWVAPVERGREQGHRPNADAIPADKGFDYDAGVIYGSTDRTDPTVFPPGTGGAVVVWAGTWPPGTYGVTLEGEGSADLWLQADGEAASAGFVGGVREGTINLPGDHPGILAVGCTVDRVRWTSIAGTSLGFQVQPLDGAGLRPLLTGDPRSLSPGEVCWFSSAGPTLTGVPKPEISAPGAGVIAAMSSAAAPDTMSSMFTNPSCPARPTGARDGRCMQIDAFHAVSVGTSMSAPLVSGAIALLFQKAPTLTQDKVVMLLQAGAHRFTAPVPYGHPAGPGELDVLGSLDALERMADPALQLPAVEQSWLTPSTTFAPADGSIPVISIVELRTADGEHRADLFDASRLRAVARIDGRDLAPAPALTRQGPGLWTFEVRPPRGSGGGVLTLGATFDGVDIVPTKSMSIATDVWSSLYPASATGGCGVGSPGPRPVREDAGAVFGFMVAGGFLARRRWRAKV